MIHKTSETFTPTSLLKQRAEDAVAVSKSQHELLIGTLNLKPKKEVDNPDLDLTLYHALSLSMFDFDPSNGEPDEKGGCTGLAAALAMGSDNYPSDWDLRGVTAQELVDQSRKYAHDNGLVASPRTGFASILDAVTDINTESAILAMINNQDILHTIGIVPDPQSNIYLVADTEAVISNLARSYPTRFPYRNHVEPPYPSAMPPIFAATEEALAGKLRTDADHFEAIIFSHPEEELDIEKIISQAIINGTDNLIGARFPGKF